MRIHELLAIAVIVLTCGSCDRKSAEQQNGMLTDSLTATRQQLKELQARLAEKDQSISRLQLRLDSLQSDTLKLGLYNPQLIGNWLVNMKCTETSCDGSAVGDSQSEQWQLSYLGESIVVHVINKGKLTRTYKGVYTREGLQLEDQANRGQAAITITMSPASGGKMEGLRMITQQDCRIVYEVNAELMDTGNVKR